LDLFKQVQLEFYFCRFRRETSSRRGGVPTNFLEIKFETVESVVSLRRVATFWPLVEQVRDVQAALEACLAKGWGTPRGPLGWSRGVVSKRLTLKTFIKTLGSPPLILDSKQPIKT